MSISSSELKLYQAANMPEDDASLTGGAISTAGKMEFTDIGSTGTVDYVSDGADTRSVTVTGRDASGAIVAETKTLNGTTPVTGSQSFERILKIVTTSDASRTVTITAHSGGATIATLEPTITSSRRFFYNSASGASGKTYYEKAFWKNTHGSLQLNSAQLTLTADPAAKIRIGCAPSKGDSATVSNRLTAPSSVTFVDDSVAQSVPTGALAAGETIGMWVEFALSSNNAAIKNSFTSSLSGTSV